MTSTTTPDITSIAVLIIFIFIFIFIIGIFITAVWRLFDRIFNGINYLSSKEDERQKKIKEEKTASNRSNNELINETFIEKFNKLNANDKKKFEQLADLLGKEDKH